MDNICRVQVWGHEIMHDPEREYIKLRATIDGESVELKISRDNAIVLMTDLRFETETLDKNACRKEEIDDYPGIRRPSSKSSK